MERLVELNETLVANSRGRIFNIICGIFHRKNSCVVLRLSKKRISGEKESTEYYDSGRVLQSSEEMPPLFWTL